MVEVVPKARQDSRAGIQTLLLEVGVYKNLQTGFTATTKGFVLCALS